MFDCFSCARAAQMLQTNSDLKKKWQYAVEWLNDELERRPYGSNNQYAYNNWSPPAQSNETSNGYFLERSHSARITLAKAVELCPEEVGPSAAAAAASPHSASRHVTLDTRVVTSSCDATWRYVMLCDVT